MLQTVRIPLALLAAVLGLAAPLAADDRPSIVLIMADDMGYSDLGCYGSEILTPNIDRLARDGMRLTQFYNAARCCPTRAALMTGLYAHQVGMGHMTQDRRLPGYRGNLARESATIAEVLRSAGYQTFMCGKWHLTRHVGPQGPRHTWPLQRGFDKFFGTVLGGGSYFDPQTLCRDNLYFNATGDFYYTDEISEAAARYVEEAARRRLPFFLYVAYTAPHWPLHAREQIIGRYRGKYASGWDRVRERRREELIRMGIVRSEWPLSPRDPSVPEWGKVTDRPWQERRMEVYAAQVDSMDRGVGQILDQLRKSGAEQNTLVMFLTDNGGCAEELGDHRPGHVPPKTRDGRTVQFGNRPNLMPGDGATFQSYGVGWANASNTPFRLYKHYVHEGGIATPLVVRWPAVIRRGGHITHQVGHVIDIMATCCDVAETKYPVSYGGIAIPKLEGRSLVPVFRGEARDARPLYWEHEGNRAVRDGKWKLVMKRGGPWELYDIQADRTETNNLAEQVPVVAKYMARMWEQWAERVHVEPWERVRAQTPRP